MKIYHKFFLYQNKLLQPYVRLLLRLMAIITYLASIMLIVGVIYEHGFTLSAHEVTKIHLLYKTVWIIFLIDVRCISCLNIEIRKRISGSWPGY